VTESDLAKVDRLISGKPEAPERIYGWLNTQLSLARHYGGCKYNGHSYVVAYGEEGQPLVRQDVVRREHDSAKAENKKKLKEQMLASLAAQKDLL
jgi:hypothetical protein